MRSKMVFLLGIAFVASLAGAQTKTYTVQKGDTVSGIANRFKVRGAELAAANSLSNSHKLRVGAVLRIPARRPNANVARAERAERETGKTVWVVRNGESDWTIARRNQMTVRELHALNPNVNFDNLQIGERLVLGTKPTKPVTAAKTTSPVATTATPTAKPKATSVAKSAPTPKKPAKVATRNYTIKAGDNDWTLARRLDTRVAVLNKLNPGVNLKRIRPGQVIKVPAVMGANLDGTADSSARVAQNRTPSTTPRPETPSALKGKYAQVNVERGIVRRGAKTNSEKVTTVDKGTPVVVLDHLDGWYKLRFPRGTVGWMRGDLLKSVRASEVAREREEARRNVVRNDSSSERTPVVTTPRRSTSRPATASRPTSTSSNARLTANRPASPRSSTRVASTQVRSGLLATAHDQMGVRYRWGGTSRGGFDCSGFVQYVYRKHGVTLPRTSREMASSGRSVSRNNLKSGDLVLFQTRRSSRVSHVGIYIGNGRFIHASSGGGRVRTDSLNSGYYSRRLVATRRVVSDAKAEQIAKPATKVAEKPKIEAPKVDEAGPTVGESPVGPQ